MDISVKAGAQRARILAPTRGLGCQRPTKGFTPVAVGKKKHDLRFGFFSRALAALFPAFTIKNTESWGKRRPDGGGLAEQ